MKLKYLAKDYAQKECPEDMNGDRIIAYDSFSDGFKTAFKTINTSLEDEIAKIEQYPMMYERIAALKLYMKKMDDILKESTDE